MPEQRSGLGLRGGGALPPMTAAQEAEWQRRNPGETRSCFWSHLGLYVMDPKTLRELTALASNGVLPRAEFTGGEDDDDAPAYKLTDEGVAVIRLHGPMKKARSKFGGTSTVDARRQLRAARDSAAVRGILLHVESPGGHVEGTRELAEEVRATAKAKPLHAYIEGMGASAALWVASQASRITANSTAQVGSIGVLAVVHDVSGNFEMHGVKVHVVASGESKGAGTPGTEVTDACLAEVRDYVDAVWAMFRDAMASGRSLSSDQMDAVSSGRVWIAARAQALGLIDGVGSYEQALEAVARAGGAVVGAGTSLATAMRRQRQAEAELAHSTLAPDRLDVAEVTPAWPVGASARAGGHALLAALEEEGDEYPEDEDLEEDEDEPAAEGDEDLEEDEDEPAAEGDEDLEEDEDEPAAEGDEDLEEDEDEPAAEGDEDLEEDEDEPAAEGDEDLEEDEDEPAAEGDEDLEEDEDEPAAEGDEDLEEDEDEPAAEGDEDLEEGEDEPTALARLQKRQREAEAARTHHLEG